jgi:hypothetical protein
MAGDEGLHARRLRRLRRLTARSRRSTERPNGDRLRRRRRAERGVLPGTSSTTAGAPRIRTTSGRPRPARSSTRRSSSSALEAVSSPAARVSPERRERAFERTRPATAEHVDVREVRDAHLGREALCILHAAPPSPSSCSARAAPGRPIDHHATGPSRRMDEARVTVSQTTARLCAGASAATSARRSRRRRRACSAS